jgi:hypothetical protein
VEAIASLIDRDIELVFDALDGKTGCRAENDLSKGDDINYREEPVAFFFILYGIAFEAVMKRDTDLQGAKDQTLEILLALKRILRPSVSGCAIYQDVVFSETMDLFDRLALTEGLAIQGVVVEITRNLCLSHPSMQEGSENSEHLSEDIEQLFELTRIIVLVLANVLPSLGEKPAPVRNPLGQDAVDLVVLSLEALVDASDVFPSVIRTDLHACLIHIFTTILGTGVCQANVVPKALPIFRRFVRAISEDIEDNPAVGNQLRSCLAKLRSILANAQRRESEASLQCARNTLMASVILLTSGSEAIAPNEPALIKLLDDLLDCLQDVGLGKVAANCTRSLLMSPSKSKTGQAITLYLFPRLLHLLVEDTQPDPENAKTLILQALVSFASTQELTDAVTTFCLVIPIILHRASMDGKESYEEMATRLLSLASADQGAFRAVVGNMGPDQRVLLEEVLKQGRVGRYDSRRDREGGGEPSIALKLTFGAS